jgi:hypothetical protein
MNETKRDDEKAHVSMEDVRRDSDGDTTDGAGKYPEDDDGLPLPGTRERIMAEKGLVRKLDSRLLPTIFVIYIMNYIDVRRIGLYEESASSLRLIWMRFY